MGLMLTDKVQNSGGCWGRATPSVIAMHSCYYGATLRMEVGMASITVRNLDEGLKNRLRIRAAQHGKSMEQEVRDILSAALDDEVPTGKEFIDRIRARFADLGGVELELPPRGPMREPPESD